MLKITTNGRKHELKALVDLPSKVQKDFDYINELDEYDLRFVEYRGIWYDTGDVQVIHVTKNHDRPMGWAMYVDLDNPMAAWHAMISDSFFSGVVFRFCDDDRVQCGTYTC